MRTSSIWGTLTAHLLWVPALGFVAPFSPSIRRTWSPTCRPQDQPGRASSADEGHGIPDTFNIGDLRKELEERKKRNDFLDQRQAQEEFDDMQRELRSTLQSVYPLIINAGLEEEGLYTLYVGGRNIVVAFEDKEEAVRCSLMLKTQEGFPRSTPRIMPTEELVSFCKDVAAGLQIVPTGSGFLPPDSSKEELGFNPALTEEDRRRATKNQSMFSPEELRDLKEQMNRKFEE